MTVQNEREFMVAALALVEQGIGRTEQACTTMVVCIERMRAAGQDARYAELDLLRFDQTLTRLRKTRGTFLRQLLHRDRFQAEETL
ncbi:hypothetical protein [Methylobacterium segetis]|uniref:hypothetical protein n=1 Tax=Methylobacterium segetis TaxID=2488750 RepID=UPI001404889B|nr:hypothetical protein [Methylobacterium segetis]